MVVLMRTAFATRQKGEPMNDLISRQAVDFSNLAEGG